MCRHARRHSRAHTICRPIFHRPFAVRRTHIACYYAIILAGYVCMHESMMIRIVSGSVISCVHYMPWPVVSSSLRLTMCKIICIHHTYMNTIYSRCTMKRISVSPVCTEFKCEQKIQFTNPTVKIRRWYLAHISIDVRVATQKSAALYIIRVYTLHIIYCICLIQIKKCIIIEDPQRKNVVYVI